jgi:hypothetical protein
VLCILAVGCGGGNDGKPEAISGPAKEVADTIQRLEKATAARDFTTVCGQLLASATRKQAGGEQCPDVLDQRARGVRRPRIKILSIEVQGNQAQARVRTTAVGQASVPNVIRLVREQGRFRIASLN